MAEKSSVLLLREVIESGKDYIDACLQEDVPVICMNKETKNKKHISFKLMYNNNNKFWIQNETWEYFLSNEDYQKTAEWVAKSRTGQEWHNPDDMGELETIDDSLGSEYKAIVSMSDSERIHQINEDKKRLDELIVQKPRQENRITEALVDTARDAMLHNHAALANVAQLSDEEAKKQTQGLVDSTFDLVKTSTRLLSSSIFNDELMNTLVAKSNGTIIQHMTRVHLNGLAFLTYYNNLVSSSHTITKLRITFDKIYKPFYSTLLPYMYPDNITLERVFMGGMRAVSESNFYNWAVGFLIHDVGKAAAVEYHEGEAAYNREIVIEHVKVGYSSVMNKTNYPKDAGLITGYHHEYYGDPDGYGYFRTYLEQYKNSKPRSHPDYCMTFEIQPLMDCQALAFFPAKVIEIVDVFDSVTDPNRKYRKAMTTEEALSMMDEEFIKNHPKIDLILFDIFSKFVREKEATGR
jgi:hypothetical protein